MSKSPIAERRAHTQEILEPDSGDALFRAHDFAAASFATDKRFAVSLSSPDAPR